MTVSTLSTYYRAIDDGRLEAALALLDEHVRFVIVLPADTRRGSSREDMAGYLLGRGVSDRRHVLLREARATDVEFVYGKVTEGPGAQATGYFVAAARLSPDGLVLGYQVTFETDQSLLADGGE